VSGVVVSREVDIGQTVAASFQTPTLFKIARDLSRMQIDSNVAEADIGKVRVGQPVRFTVDAFPERSFEGRVQQIRLAPLVQQNVVTYNVVVEVSNPDLVLMPGMTAYLRIVTDRAENALLVPNAALRFRPPEAGGASAQAAGQARAASEGNARPHRELTAASPRVYVIRDGELAAVALETGISDGRYTAARGTDLKSGDLVVVEDLQAAPKGSVTGGQQFRLRF
jgi:HlyD family secretion protein